MCWRSQNCVVGWMVVEIVSLFRGGRDEWRSCEAVRVVCGKRLKAVEYPSVCLSVCPVDRQHQGRAAGLLLSSGGFRTKLHQFSIALYT